MENQNPVFGRKIYFINPPYAIKTTLIDRLRALEYEAYYIHDPRSAKAILENNPDSLCFVCIDSILPTNQWFNFIKSFETNDNLKSIFIGILSQNIKTSEKNQFLLKTNIPGGFISLTESFDKITDKIIQICELNGAKGRRQYVRLNCNNYEETFVHISKNGRLYPMKLIDISSVGFACMLKTKDKSIFTEKEILKPIVITLGLKTINIEAAVFALKENPNYVTMVMLFMPSTSATTKDIIRNYVFSMLQGDLDMKVEITVRDNTDYSKDLTKETGDKSSAFINEEEITSDTNLDEVSDLEEAVEQEQPEQSS